MIDDLHNVIIRQFVRSVAMFLPNECPRVEILEINILFKKKVKKCLISTNSSLKSPQKFSLMTLAYTIFASI